MKKNRTFIFLLLLVILLEYCSCQSLPSYKDCVPDNYYFINGIISGTLFDYAIDNKPVYIYDVTNNSIAFNIYIISLSKYPYQYQYQKNIRLLFSSEKDISSEGFLLFENKIIKPLLNTASGYIINITTGNLFKLIKSTLKAKKIINWIIFSDY